MDQRERQPVKEKPVQSKKRRKPPSRARITAWVILTLIGIMVTAVAGVTLYIWNGLRPASDGAVVQMELKTGMSPFDFAEEMEEKGIIRDAFMFKYYLRLKDEGPGFQAGVYELAPGMDKDAIIAKLNAGDTVKKETVRFTIPEGYTLEQIADTLASAGMAEKSAFLALADTDRAWGDIDTVRSIPKDAKGMRHRLEGYLFPETYELEKDSKPEAIILRMLQEMDRKLDTLPENWEDTMAERKLDYHSLLTIASLVEREVVVDEERPIVASVIFNRMKKNMLLQIDATVQYSLDKPKERLFEKDLLVDSPYNTYQNKGLPPGPIASPSIKSIEAVLFPADTDYYYYVTKKDGSSGHLFAKTLREHNSNIRKSNEIAK